MPTEFPQETRPNPAQRRGAPGEDGSALLPGCCASSSFGSSARHQPARRSAALTDWVVCSSVLCCTSAAFSTWAFIDSAQNWL